MPDPMLNRLFQELAPLLCGKGYELLDIRWATGEGGRALRVTIDHLPSDKDQRITVDDCALVSRLIDPIVDMELGLGRRYELEVSSPGRPLR